MATVINFSRRGTKKKPIFHIVVKDSRSSRDGQCLEKLGIYNPVKGSETVRIERPRLDYWLGVGAKMSDSVASLLKDILKQGAQPTTPAAEAKKPADKKKAKKVDGDK